MTKYDYIKLLWDYFPGSFEDCSYDDLEIFTSTAFRWLELLEGGHSEFPSSELLHKLADAITVVSYRNSHRLAGDRRPLHSTYAHWTRHLETWQEDAPVLLPEHCGPGLRSLLHAFERAWRTNVLPPCFRAYDDLRIPLRLLHLDTGRCLHHALQLAHDGLDACEGADCQWVAHSCDDWSICPLLHIDVEAFPPRFETPADEELPHWDPQSSPSRTPHRSLRQRIIEACKRALRDSPQLPSAAAGAVTMQPGEPSDTAEGEGIVGTRVQPQALHKETVNTAGTDCGCGPCIDAI